MPGPIRRMRGSVPVVSGMAACSSGEPNQWRQFIRQQV